MQLLKNMLPNNS